MLPSKLTKTKTFYFTQCNC